MKKLLPIGLFSLLFTVNGIADGSGPDIRIVDNKVSIHAEAIPLSRLLRLLDQATGLTSKVPPELANRNISVRFTDLNFDEAIQKIFEGQPLDYVVVAGKSIIVTGTSQTLTAKNAVAPATAPPVKESMNEENPGFLQQPQQQPFQQQFQQPVPGVANGAQNQPPMIQTPFGAIPNPRANQQQGVGSPGVTPGQTAPPNPFNSSLPGFSSPNQLPTMQSNPMFGTPANTQPQPTNSPFGTAPSAYPSAFPNAFPGTTTTPPRPNP